MQFLSSVGVIGMLLPVEVGSVEVGSADVGSAEVGSVGGSVVGAPHTDSASTTPTSNSRRMIACGDAVRE